MPKVLNKPLIKKIAETAKDKRRNPTSTLYYTNNPKKTNRITKKNKTKNTTKKQKTAEHSRTPSKAHSIYNRINIPLKTKYRKDRTDQTTKYTTPKKE